MKGPVHPDFPSIGLCAEALHLARQHKGIAIMRDYFVACASHICTAISGSAAGQEI
jgi:hypothetical protein